MDTRLLDVFHDTCHDGFGPVADGVHIDLHGVFQKLVDRIGWPGDTSRARTMNCRKVSVL